MKIYPYSSASKSAKALANVLNIKRLHRGGKPIAVKDVVINWGAARFNREIDCPVILNPPEAVRLAANKLQTFKRLQGIASIPEWTESAAEAAKWLVGGSIVVARTVLNGHSGEGIVIMEEEKDFIEDVPLYVKYIPKKHEYRAHVFRGQVFFEQRKERAKDVPDDKVNWKIRNHGNGFIFAHQDVKIPDEGKHEAIMAVGGLGLDFGAVDLIQGAKDKKWYVLEVNTACGIENTTLEKYVEQFKGVV